MTSHIIAGLNWYSLNLWYSTYNAYAKIIMDKWSVRDIFEINDRQSAELISWDCLYYINVDIHMNVHRQKVDICHQQDKKP